ncbi:angiomotin-like [Acanthochromis polyacanthus]|uniref:angiomotin-like n=1 Tax=Acanthochromis polyacanthus TaxID=80966 RepID=UPI002234213C|nr:angiomotin-like [Acanthochromis polyacanthus]XP_051810926.1 angiomotin-like [Acanthochromis polyacanthus]
MIQPCQFAGVVCWLNPCCETSTPLRQGGITWCTPRIGSAFYALGGAADDVERTPSQERDHRSEEKFSSDGELTWHVSDSPQQPGWEEPPPDEASSLRLVGESLQQAGELKNHSTPWFLGDPEGISSVPAFLDAVSSALGRMFTILPEVRNLEMATAVLTELQIATDRVGEIIAAFAVLGASLATTVDPMILRAANKGLTALLMATVLIEGSVLFQSSDESEEPPASDSPDVGPISVTEPDSTPGLLVTLDPDSVVDGDACPAPSPAFSRASVTASDSSSNEDPRPVPATDSHSSPVSALASTPIPVEIDVPAPILVEIAAPPPDPEGIGSPNSAAVGFFTLFPTPEQNDLPPPAFVQARKDTQLLALSPNVSLAVTQESTTPAGPSGGTSAPVPGLPPEGPPVRPPIRSPGEPRPRRSSLQ